jgi:hypothetical protein
VPCRGQVNWPVSFKDFSINFRDYIPSFIQRPFTNSKVYIPPNGIKVQTMNSKRFGTNAHAKFWLKSIKRRDHLEDLNTDGRIILKFL